MIEHSPRLSRRARRIVGAAALASLASLAAVRVAWVPVPGTTTAAAQEQVSVFLPLGFAHSEVELLPRVRGVTATPTSAVPSATPSPTETLAPALTPSPVYTATPSPSPTPEGYHEPLTEFADLSDLKSGYSAGRWYETMLAVLERRYPTGHYIVTHLDDSRANAQRWVGGSTASWDSLMHALQLAVHEMDHQLGIQEAWLPSGGREYAYVVRADKVVTVTNHSTFARSEIAQYVTGSLENMYKGTYLSGTSGRQGFTNLLDEVNAYTHSLFTAYGVHDQFPPGMRSSHRDGLVTFMMYTQFYLRHGRLKHPADYARLHDDPEMRDLVELLWDRANFILDTTAPLPGLAMNPAAIEAEMRKAEMQDEIAQFVAPSEGRRR